MISEVDSHLCDPASQEKVILIFIFHFLMECLQKNSWDLGNGRQCIVKERRRAEKRLKERSNDSPLRMLALGELCWGEFWKTRLLENLLWMCRGFWLKAWMSETLTHKPTCCIYFSKSGEARGQRQVSLHQVTLLKIYCPKYPGSLKSQRLSQLCWASWDQAHSRKAWRQPQTLMLPLPTSQTLSTSPVLGTSLASRAILLYYAASKWDPYRNIDGKSRFDKVVISSIQTS